MAEKKINSPLLLRLIPRVFPTLERIVPFLAYKFATKLFLTPFRYKVPLSEKEFIKTGRPFQVEVNKKKIRGFTWGEGMAIIGVHGWSGRGAMLRKFVSPLVTAGFKVVIFDGPAHGLSTGFSTDLLDFEATLHRVTSKFGPVAGYLTHSFGGTATLFAFSRGLKPKPIVLIAVPAIGEDIIQSFTHKINGSRKVITRFEEFTANRYGGSFYEASAINTAKKIGQTPTLVIHDNDDRDVPVKHGEHLMDSLPNGSFFRTSGLGHNRILRDPSVVNHVTEFFTHHIG